MIERSREHWAVVFPRYPVDAQGFAHYAPERVRRRTPAAADSGGLELDLRGRRLLGLDPW